MSGEKFNKGIEDPEGQDLQRDNRHGRNISGDVPEGPELVKLNSFLGKRKGPTPWATSSSGGIGEMSRSITILPAWAVSRRIYSSRTTLSARAMAALRASSSSGGRDSKNAISSTMAETPRSTRLSIRRA